MKRLAASLALVFAIMGSGLSLTADWHALVEPVSHYRQTLLWMSDDTLGERLRALVYDQRHAIAALYQLMHALCLGFVLAMTMNGLAYGWLRGTADVLPLRQAKILAIGMGGLVALSPLLRPLMQRAADTPGAQMALAAMPAYWLFGMLASASILGLYAALAAHDLALVSRARVLPWLSDKLQPRPAAAK